MSDNETDCLISFKWNNHQTTFFNVLANLRTKDIYTDVTLACEQKFVSAHKLILSSCSDYFKEIFARAACISPVIVLKDIKSTELDALIDYMYLGEVDVQESEVNGILRAAECLQIKGLGVPDENPDVQCSSTSPTNEEEFLTPTKKIKFENEKFNRERQPPSNSKPNYINEAKSAPKSSIVKTEKKFRDKTDAFPYLIEGLKATKNARRSNNVLKLTKPQLRKKALRAMNRELQKPIRLKNREIKVTALPTSGTEIRLMTLPMNDEELKSEESVLPTQDPKIILNLNTVPVPKDKDDLNIVGKSADYITEHSNSSSIYGTSTDFENSGYSFSSDLQMDKRLLKQQTHLISNHENFPEKNRIPNSNLKRNINEITNLHPGQDATVTKEQNLENNIETDEQNLEHNKARTESCVAIPINYNFAVFCKDMRTVIKARHPKANPQDAEELLQLLKSEWYELKKYELKARQQHSKYMLNILSEEEMTKITLPNFSDIAYPYLNGENITHKTRCTLRTIIVDELLTHFRNSDQRLTKIPNFLHILESSLINEYPNIIEDSCKKKKGHLGSLLYMLHCKLFLRPCKRRNTAEKVEEMTLND